MAEHDAEERIESYVMIGVTALLCLYILLGAYIHHKKVALNSDL
jgi:hypothetical protein